MSVASSTLGAESVGTMTEYPNWFEYVRPNFEEFLKPLAGQKDLTFMQLGVFTGDASVWMLENILTDPNSRLTDVDTWQGSKEEAHATMDFDDVYRVYENKTKKFLPNLRIVNMTTVDWLMTPAAGFTKYDFIYIDADHTTVGVLVDAELSWPLLKSGGIMAFDDYTWGHDSGDPRLAPQVGIDLFLHRHELDYQLLTKNHQVWIRKR